VRRLIVKLVVKTGVLRQFREHVKMPVTLAVRLELVAPSSSFSATQVRAAPRRCTASAAP
jgi:hypothetical protein